MQIDGFEQIKQYTKWVKEIQGECYISFHKMRNGTPFVIICTSDYAQAVFYKNQKIENLCTAFFEKRLQSNGSNCLFVTSIRSTHERIGVGSAMMDVVKNHAIKNDCECIRLYSLGSAKDFYKKIGFIFEGKIVDYINCSFDLKKLSKKKNKNLELQN